MFTDGIWWFFMTWLPLFLFEPPYNLNLKNIGWPLVTIYLMADVGAVAGGELLSVMIRRGATVNLARKTAMLICGLCAVPIMFVPHIHNMWCAVLIIGLAVAGHQGYSSNLYTVVSDLFPKNLVASVAGLADSSATSPFGLPNFHRQMGVLHEELLWPILLRRSPTFYPSPSCTCFRQTCNPR